RHLRHENDRVEMSDHIVGMTFYTVEQNLLAKPLTVDSRRLKDLARFEAVFGLAALVVRHEARHRQRILRFVKVDDLPVRVGLKGGERRQKIDRFEDGGFALRVLSHQHNSPPWKVGIQAGETAEVGEGEVFEMHVEVGG